MKQSFLERFKIVGLPVFQLEVMRHEYLFVADSGSQYNVISTDLFKELALEQESVESLDLFGIGGKSETMPFYSLRYSIDGEEFDEKFAVASEDTFTQVNLSGIQIDGLIGSTFMIKHNFIIDYSQCVLYTAENEVSSK